MSLDRKIKIGLDETRLLVLGATILLGFQFQSVFQERFAELSGLARTLNGIALMLMVAAVALLVAPATRHRLAADGHATPDLPPVIIAMVGWALLPFAVSLGLTIFVALESYGTAFGVSAGLLLTALALWFWYGFGLFHRTHRKGVRSMPTTSHKTTPLEVRIDQMLTEARVLLPGAQALLGFQLIITLSKTFPELPAASKVVHAAALACIALTIVLLMAPAAYHRIVHGGEDTEDVHRTGSVFIGLASVPLAFGIAGDVYVTIERISGSAPVGAAAALAALAVSIGLWHVYPLVLRERRADGATGHRGRTEHI